MDYVEAAKLAKEYKPPVIYRISDIVSKTGAPVNPLHMDVIGCQAYPLYTEVGERGYIRVIPSYDYRYHNIHTSTVVNFTPWGNGESVVTIETLNTIYTLTKNIEET